MWPERTVKSHLGVAVSGGADSLALLLLAHAHLPDLVEAATVDHGLRAESAAEAAMVARLCGELGVPHQTLAITVAPGNLQHRARVARYDALGGWAQQRGLGALATGHQLDDQAETLAMRLNRGSGLAGLAGVRARGEVPGHDLPLLRPLIGWRRTELAGLVEAAGIDAVSDPSNIDTRFDRVRTREGLATSNWLDAEGIARSAAMLGEAEDYLVSCVDEAWARRVLRTGSEVVFEPGASDFESCEIVRRILADFGYVGSRSDIAALVARLRNGANGSLGGVLARPLGGVWRAAAPPPRRSR